MSRTYEEYGKVHHQVRKLYGPASLHTCRNCPSLSDEWAHLHDTDPQDPENYVPLCFSCHRSYDGNLPGRYDRTNYQKLSVDDLKRIRELRSSGRTVASVAAEFGVSKRCIYKRLRRDR